MPELSRFFGIVIFMNYREHDPANFHARYQGQEVSIEIETGLVRGEMSKRALTMIFEWMETPSVELQEGREKVKAREVDMENALEGEIFEPLRNSEYLYELAKAVPDSFGIRDKKSE